MMDNSKGFVKLPRTYIDWEWYSDPITRDIFVYLLIRANYVDKDWKGITIHRGELVTSHKRIAEETKFTVRNVRTAIKHLKSTGELTDKVTNKPSRNTHVIQLVHYDEYQGNDSRTDSRTDSRLTVDRHKTDSRTTLTKERKESNKENTDNNASELFEIFWSVYPKKEAKEKARRVFDSLQVDNDLLARMMEAITVQKRSEQWNAEEGRYIPSPTNWLADRRWEDETTTEDEYDPYWGMEHFD